MSTTNVSPLTTVADALGRPAGAVAFNWERFRRSASFLLLLCAGLVIAADVLFYRHPLGFTPAIFAALIVIALTLRSGRYLRTRAGQIIFIGLIGLCLALLEHPGPLRFTMTLLALASLAIINTRGFTPSVPAWIARWTELLGRCGLQVPLDLVARQRWFRHHQLRRADSATRHIINWAIPLGLSLVFIGMFALANPVISRWLGTAGEQIGRFLGDFFHYISVSRILLWLVVACCAWAFLRGRTRSGRTAGTIDSVAPLVRAEHWVSPGLIVRCLILFNIIFAVQMTLDVITYLSEGAALPEGMSYREYARRGAYPLVATALLAAAFVLITFRSGRDQNISSTMHWARRLVYLWIAQNILLTGTAMLRLQIYVEGLGLTHLRLAAAIWMLLVALGLAFIIWRIVSHRSNAWLLRVNFVTLLATLYVCCFLNSDRIIAEHDLRNCEENGGDGPRIDLAYLRSLGPESIPTMRRLASALGPADPVGKQAASFAGILRDDLHDDMQTWHGWTLRRARLAAQLEQ